MDADSEQHYQASERAYGLASTLWDQLQSASDEDDTRLVLGWRAVVSLLLGHTQLHGLQQPEQAAFSYQRVLAGEVGTAIAALAEQGLERCRSEQIASEAGTTPATDGAIPDLLKDPFLSTDPDQAKPALADVVTAMPWLSSDDEPRAMPLRIPHPLRLLSQALSQRSPLKPIQWRWRTRNQYSAKKSHPSTQSSSNPRSLWPQILWRYRGCESNSNLRSKAPPTPRSRWG